MFMRLIAAEPRIPHDFYFSPSVIEEQGVSLSPWNSVFDSAGPASFKSSDIIFFSKQHALICFQLVSICHLSFYGLVFWGWVLGLIGCQSYSLGLAFPTVSRLIERSIIKCGLYKLYGILGFS